MPKADDMRRLIDLANNNKIISESHSDDNASPFKSFSSWSNLSENTPYLPDVRDKYSEEQLVAFQGLANAQRGFPEVAMLAAQSVLGKYQSGNLYGNLLEHIGDLTNRMANPHHIGATYGKLDALINLNNPVDIERMSKIPHTPEAEAYSKAHAALPVYNEAQRLARNAAVSLGRKDFETTKANLTILKKWKDAGRLEIEAGKYDPDFEINI